VNTQSTLEIDELHLLAKVIEDHLGIKSPNLPNNVLKHDSTLKYHQCVNTESFSDIKFICQEKTIFAHSVFLCARSQYFHAMLNINMKESRERIVDVPNARYQTFIEFLKFIYGCPISINSEDTALELLTLSEQYQSLRLKNLCEQWLITNYISSDTVLLLVQYADQYNASQLKEWCIDYILRKDYVNLIQRKEYKKNKELQSELKMYSPGPFGIVINHGYMMLKKPKKKWKKYFFIYKHTPILSTHELLYLKNETTTTIKGIIPVTNNTRVEKAPREKGLPPWVIKITAAKNRYWLLFPPSAKDKVNWLNVLIN